MSAAKVKALDWYKDAAGDFAADTPFGKYHAWRFSWGWDVEFNNRSVDDAKGLPSAGKAKAAAQADYERRIMSALDGVQ